MISEILNIDVEVYNDDKEISIRSEDMYVLSSKAIKKLIKPFNPIKGQKVYLAKGCNIPRVKIKNYYDEKGYNISNTNNIENADICIIGKDFINKNSDNDYHYVCKVEALKDVLTQVADNGWTVHIDDDLFTNYKYDEVIVDSNFNRIMDHIIPNFEYINMQWKSVRTCNWSQKHDINEISQKILVSESDLLKDINGDDAVVIDSERYKQLSSMITSSDDDNIILAMEIMANCHYTKSLVYLNLLFYNYCGKFENESRAKRHVNFKSLLTYMGLEPGDMTTNCENVIANLANRKCLTEDNLNIYCKEFVNNLQLNDKKVRYYRNTPSVKINEVELNHPSIIEAMGKPFIYKCNITDGN
jgi:hypothetical protein